MTQRMSDTVKQQPLLVAGLALLVGILLGWFVIGWGLWPVAFVNADASQLRPDLQQDWVRLTAAEFTLNPDLNRAATRIDALGANASQVISDTLATSSADEKVRVLQLKQVLESTGHLKPGGSTPAEASLLDKYKLPLLGCSLLIVLALAAGGAWYLWSSGALSGGRPAGAAARTAVHRPAAVTAQRSAAVAPKADYSATGTAATPTGNPPVAQFMTTYVLGDDLYDDSFSIDPPDGSFLGECGMGISETIGVGDPKKVMAFEVWLFDKNDIRTVTKVLMSEHAFRDEALKSRLAAKGEPVLVTSGDVVSMETASLVVTARVVDMAYGGGALPPNSFFERLTIELAAFSKAAA
ncbi:MAG: hypothetical protein ABI847_18295 [Anaerolineales bacterium]